MKKIDKMQLTEKERAMARKAMGGGGWWLSERRRRDTFKVPMEWLAECLLLRCFL